MKKTTKITLLFLILLISLVTIRLVFLYHQPHKDMTQEIASIKIASEDLLKDFQEDESLANTIYLEQITQVQGTITAIENNTEEVVIVLSEPDSFGGIRCHISPEEYTKVSALTTGQQITIKGICTGYLMDVVLVRCVLIP